MPNEEQKTQTTPSVSALDPDFLLFALPLAIIIDALNYVSLGTIGAIVNLLLGWMLIFWVRTRTGTKVQTPQRKELQKKIVRKAILRYVYELIPLWNYGLWWTRMVFGTLKQQMPEQEIASPSASKTVPTGSQA